MIRYFVNHPTAANLLMVGFLIVGLINLPSLQLETFPQISIKEVEIRVVYPGATPLDVERAICRRIEDGLSGLENLNEQRCEARENMGLATAEMVEGGDIDQFMTDVQNEIDAITDFPDTAEDAVVEQRGRMSVVASLVITGLEDQTDLKLYAEQLKDQMLRYGGIPQVDVEGFSDRQFRIEIQDKAARELGLTLDDVANAITRQNVDLPAGEITSENGATILRFSDERRALDAYRSVIVASSDLGGQITLGEIARITDQFEDEEVEIQLDGDLAAVLDISKARADDTMRVMNQVNSFLEEERQRAPPGVTLTIIGDTSVALQDRLSMLTANSLQGILLVVAAMWLFFGYRQAFWIGMGLPVSFLGALALMAVSGLSINMLSMVGLLIVIGILMDDAIVIAENIAAKREQGLAPMDAAVAGTLQVMPGVISSFLTTVCVFGSLAFISGDLGELLRVIPIVMIMVLAVSLVEAFLILPNHLGHSANADKPGLITRKVEGGVAWTRDHIIGPVADFAVHYRYLTLGLAVMLFLASVSLLAGGAVKFQAFPEIDDNQLEARIELAASARLEDTRKIVEEVSLALDRVNAALSPDNVDGQPLVESVLVRFNENRDAGTNGAHLATIAVDVIETDQRTATNEQILAAWTAEVPDTLDVRQITLTEPSAGPAGRAVEIRLQHPDITVLEQASEDLRRWLAAYAGVYNLADDLSLGKPELAISLMDGAGALGVDARMIADQLRAAFYGVTADEIQIGSESFEIDVRLASTNRDSIGDLDSFTIETPAGERVPLNTIAEITPERGYTRLNRIDRLPTVIVSADLQTNIANATEVVGDTEGILFPQLYGAYPGLTISIEGQNAEGGETQASMITALGLGLIGVFVLLSFQFRSYVEPVVVMVLIPFGLIGAVTGHLIMGIDFSLPSTLGFISLTGIVVNNSILLVYFIKNEHGAGVETVAEAAPEGARRRFRAMLLTSVTTVAGMAPLLFETSTQAQVLIPLVTSISFGLVATTLLIVFVVPAFYTILDDFNLTSLAAERKAHHAHESGADTQVAQAPAE